MKTHTYKSNFTTQIELCPAKDKNLTVVYIHGLYSDPFGRKPEDVKAFCEQKGMGFVRFELIGHGSDIANYEKANLNIWREQVNEVISTYTSGDIMMMGSSLGGWLSLCAALDNKDRVKGVVGLAAAPDFTDDLINYLPKEKVDEINTKGRIEFTNNDFTYLFTKSLIDSGAQNLLLKDKIALTCPVHLIQGMKDTSLDWRKALKIASLVESENVVVKLLKDSSHNLGSDIDAKEIKLTLESITADILA